MQGAEILGEAICGVVGSRVREDIGAFKVLEACRCKFCCRKSTASSAAAFRFTDFALVTQIKLLSQIHVFSFQPGQHFDNLRILNQMLRIAGHLTAMISES